MFCYGISNRLEDNKYIFFYEFDKKKIDDVQYEALNLSKKFKIDIAILKSSTDSYHLVSFDVLTKDEVKNICAHVTLDSDFVPLDEQKLLGNPYEDNCLRIGRKFTKANPKFIAWVHTPENDRYKAMNHLITYHVFCGVPLYPIPEFLKIPYKVYFVIYNTGVRRKMWLGGLRRKPYEKT